MTLTGTATGHITGSLSVDAEPEHQHPVTLNAYGQSGVSSRSRFPHPRRPVG
jgi:hypothetical protein